LKLFNTSLITISLISTTLLANTQSKVAIKGNMNLTYNSLPKSVTNIEDILSNSIVYGRLRAHSFIYDYDTQNSKDHDITGIGGSVIIKTAPYHGFSSTLGLYTSQTPFNKMSDSQISIAKSGKDLFSRNDVQNGNGWGMSVIGQAYLEANRGNTTAKLGRQLVHTVFTASNDTKMIPNTFDGITFTNTSLAKTTIKAAYLTAQKLRDHTSSHDVLAYSDWTVSSEGNDDSGVNKSLTTSEIGTDNKLIILSTSTKAFENYKFDLSIANVPDVFTSTIFEGNHIFKFDNGMVITPAIRYINQCDNLNSIKNVANLQVDTTGYTNPTSLDASAFMAKVDIKKGAAKFRIGYSKIDDKADLIAPWRGFPTGGYTRAMAQYNWYANTKTYMIRADYDFGKAGISDNLTGLIRYAVQDFDDNKSGVQADSKVIHFDLLKKLSPNIYTKLRIGLVDADPKSTGKSDVSYNEYRFELNYLF